MECVELQSHSTTEMPDIVVFSSDFEAECATDCPPISSSGEENEQDFGNSKETVSSLESELAQWVVSSQLTRESCWVYYVSMAVSYRKTGERLLKRLALYKSMKNV